MIARSGIFLMLVLACAQCMTLVGCQETSKPKTQVALESPDLRRTYFKDGKIKSEVPLKNGIPHGLSKSYYPGGGLRLELTYVNGKKEGLSKWYYESGKVYQTTSYQAGVVSGVQTKYQENGKVISTQTWHQDEPCSDLVEYLLNGKIHQHYPALVITPVDNRAVNNTYLLRISNTEKLHKVHYYLSALSSTGCLPHLAEAIPTDHTTGVATLRINLRPGEHFDQVISIIGRLETANQNFYITQKNYHLVLN